MTNWGIASLRKRDWQALSAWLFTIVLLAGGFGLYSYLYVERREQYFTEKKLRELRLLGDRLKLQVENIANNVLPNAVKAAESYAESDCETKISDPALKVYETDGAVITSARSASLEETCGFLAVSNKTQLVRNFRLDKLVEYRRTPGAASNLGTGAGPPSRVTVRIEGDTPALLFTYQTSQAQNSLTPRWRGRIEVPNLLGQSGLDSFDQLVVTDLKGEVQFQVGTTRVVPTNVSSIVERAARMDSSSKSSEGSNVPPSSGWPSVRDSTSVVTVKLAGEDYVLFLQPVKIALLGNETADQLSAGSSLDWRVAGLISKDRFRRDSSTFSYTTIVVFLFVLLLLVFAEPFIKIRSLGVLDRLQKRDVIFLFVSAALTTALFTLFSADLYVYGKLENEVDSQLAALAKDVQHKFDDDLSSLLRTLRNLSEEEVPPEEFTALGNLLGTPAKENVKPSEDPCKGAVDSKARPEERSKVPSTEALKNEFKNGALFERIVWIDPCGKQRRKWTIYSSVTPLIQVGERPYFQKVKNGQLWKKSVDNKAVCFWLGPIESWNTGERLATLSVRGPATSKEDSRNDASCEAHPDQGSHWVLSLDALLPSLRNAVLPPGYGFVVIDGEGSVLFHSDPARHLREDFFEESDQEPALRAAVFGRGTEFFNASYLGTDHRVHSRPFDAPTWTLLVFYDKHFLRTTNVEILSATLILFLMFLALQFPALAILWFRDTQWLWYEKARQTNYPPYLAGIFVLASLLLVVVACFSPVSVAYAAFLIPSTVLFLTYFTFGLKGSNQKARAGIGDYILSIGPPLVVVLVLFYGCWLERKSSELLVITLGAALFVGLTFVPNIKKWLNELKWFPSTRKCYLLTTAAVLVLAGFLPALAFFRVAYENEMVLLLKHGQYRLEESLSARRAQWLENALKIPGQGGKNFLETRMEKTLSREVNQDFFFPCSYSPAVVGTSTPFRSPLGYVLSEMRRHMLFDPVAIESQGLLQDALTDDSATWLGGHARCLRLVSGVADLPGTRPKQVQLNPVEVPTWWKTNSFKWLLVLALLVVALVKVVAIITTFIAKRVFLFDLEIPSDPEKSPDPAAFDAVWKECTVEEKIALYDLATDGFLNSKNRSISSLLKRGLLSFSALRLANDSFRDVILREGANDDALAPEKQDELSAWQKMKWPLLVALLGIAVFLFFSQRKVFESGVGFLGALAAAATSLFNLFDHVRGNRR